MIYDAERKEAVRPIKGWAAFILTKTCEIGILLTKFLQCNTIVFKGGCLMAEETLVIKAKKYKEESVIISARIPKDMLGDIDMISKETGRTRNEIITRLLDFGLKHTEIIED